MNTKASTRDERVALPPSQKDGLEPQHRWEALLFLVILILVGIGGLAVLSYKLEHPTSNPLVHEH